MTEGVADRVDDSETGGEQSVSQPSLEGQALDLICTKVAIDFQGLGAGDVDSQIRSGLQTLTDAWGTDAVFVALLDPSGSRIDTVFSARSDFSICNPEVLSGRELTDFPWLKGHLEHLRLIDLTDVTASASVSQARDAEELSKLNMASLVALGFELGNKIGGMFGICSASPGPEVECRPNASCQARGRELCERPRARQAAR